MSRITTVLALIFLSASAIFGQAVAIGSVSGTVSDQSGSYVPGATVNMTETDKGTVHTVTTTSEGRYTFNNLPTGPYRLDAQAKGFKNYVQTGIVLQVAENLTQNIALQVGRVDRNGGSDSRRQHGGDQGFVDLPGHRNSNASWICRSMAAISPPC